MDYSIGIEWESITMRRYYVERGMKENMEAAS